MTGRPFLFGKMPAHGDFVARGLTPDEQSAWDDWASAGIERARSDFGDAFEDAHDVAPSWRFVAEHAGAWRLGALACSVDSAGRRFVLVLGLADLGAAEAMGLGVGGAGAVETVLYQALVSRTPADETLQAVAQIGLDPADLAATETLAPSPSGPGVWWTLGGERHPPQLLEAGEPPHDLLLQVLRSPAALEMAT